MTVRKLEIFTATVCGALLMASLIGMAATYPKLNLGPLADVLAHVTLALLVALLALVRRKRTKHTRSYTIPVTHPVYGEPKREYIKTRYGARDRSHIINIDNDNINIDKLTQL